MLFPAMPFHHVGVFAERYRASAGLTRVLSSQLYEGTGTDPATFLWTAAVLTLVAIFACYLAARRASHSNPVDALNDAKL
jgi:hypothetical protein